MNNDFFENKDINEKRTTHIIKAFSHEIGTQLNAIIGFSELLKDAADPSVHTEYAYHIIDSSRQLSRIITELNDTLQFHAPETGQRRTWITVNESISKVIEFMLPMAHQANITLINDTTTCHIKINTDQYLLQNILLCMLRAVIKETRDRHDITIGAYRRKDGDLTISMNSSAHHNDNKGISETHISMDNDKKKRHDGSCASFNLSLARQLVRIHGNGLLLEYEEKKLPTATLVFPTE